MIFNFMERTDIDGQAAPWLRATERKFWIDCGLPQGNDVKIGASTTSSTRKISIISFSPMRTSIIAGDSAVDQGRVSRDHLRHRSDERASSIMLADSAHIQESEAQWQNRKAKRSAWWHLLNRCIR